MKMSLKKKLDTILNKLEKIEQRLNNIENKFDKFETNNRFTCSKIAILFTGSFRAVFFLLTYAEIRAFN